MDDAIPDAANVKYLTFHLEEKEQKIIATFHPEGETGSITPEVLRQAISEAGFGEYDLHEPAIERAAAKYNAREAFEIIVGKAVDGSFSVKCDIMSAHLTCTLPRGGAPVQMENVLQAIKEKGVAVQIDTEAIEKALREGGSSILVASGTPPVNGVDGKFESLIPRMKPRRPHLDEHGLADFRDLGEIIVVHPSNPLMRRILPTGGEPGKTIAGKDIPPKPGKAVTFAKSLEGAAPDPNDPDLLVSLITGVPVLLKDGVNVEPVFSVKDVDLHTGNISFEGTVHVTGDVHAGMTVKVTGDIHVEGTVEGAMLDAGGDIVVKGGIIGGSEQHARPGDKFHPLVKCTGTCTARFVQNAHVSAGNGIFIHDTVMQSDMTAGHQIIVGEKGSRKGDIIGGVTRAAMLVKAQVLGSHEYVKTVVNAGANRVLHERMNLAAKAREAAEKKHHDIIKILEIASLKPGRLPPDTIKAAEATRDAASAEIETLMEIEQELQKQIDLSKDAQVIVEKHIFGGTEIYFGVKRYETLEDRQGGTFRLNDEGELVFD